MNWYFRTIILDKPATTIPVMEWIRDNGCPSLDHTIFMDEFGDEMMVSLTSESELMATLNEIEEEIKEGNKPWFEYKGMYRHHTPYGWIFLINGELYWATQY